MLFVTYWELNENMSVEQRLEVAQKLTDSVCRTAFGKPLPQLNSGR